MEKWNDARICCLLGRLSFDYLPTEPATIGAAVGLPLSALAIVAALTYFKKWRWLYLL